MPLQLNYTDKFNDSLAIDSQQEALAEILRKLRADPMIGSRIVENDDGTYRFDMTAGAWTEKAFVASQIVSELHHRGSGNAASSTEPMPSENDRQLFKQLTTYNLLILGGAPTVLDSNGYPPSLADQGVVQQAFEVMNYIASDRVNGDLQGDLTHDNLLGFLQAHQLNASINGIVVSLKRLFNGQLASRRSFHEGTKQPSNEVMALMNMISI